MASSDVIPARVARVGSLGALRNNSFSKFDKDKRAFFLSALSGFYVELFCRFDRVCLKKAVLAKERKTDEKKRKKERKEERKKERKKEKQPVHAAL